MGKSSLIIIIVGLLLLTSAAFAERVELGDLQTDVEITVVESSSTRTVLRYEIAAFDKIPVDIAGQQYYQIYCGRESNFLEKGEPALPHLCRSIIIPDAAAMRANVISTEYVDISGIRVAPSKGNLTRSVNPADVPYTFDDIYNKAEWYPENLVNLREPFILRDHRGLVVELNAFRYQPALQRLRVFTSVTVEVLADGTSQENVLDRTRSTRGTPSDFDMIYWRQFLNYRPADERLRLAYPAVEETGDMLIIAYDSYYGDMAPLVEWKRQKGIKTTIARLSDVGASSSDIQSFIQDFYDSTNLAYVLLVGDAESMPTMYASGGASDPSYALVAGSDSYPDLFVGRFSAESSAHVQTQVARTITYEQQFPGTGWYSRGCGIASTEGPGHYGEYDHQHMGYIRDDLLAYDYTEVDEFYGYTASATDVAAALNAGRGIVNYCGHGSTYAWSTTGFSSSYVNSLTNDHMLPFIFSVACQNGHFDGRLCFAEAWLRATNGSNPTGAIGVYMSSIDQDWDPPMYAQDESIDLLCVEAKTSYGGLCFNGSCRMIEATGTSGINMYKTWHIFGDPSVQVRTRDAEAMTVTHEGAVRFDAAQYEVQVPGVEGALCAVYGGGTLYGSAYTNATGAATINLEGQLSFETPVLLTVTAFNKTTVVDTLAVTADLSIVHEPLGDTKDTLNDYQVQCLIYADTALIEDSLLLWYELSSTWYSMVLEEVRAGEEYMGVIPAQPAGTSVSYYLYAKTESGYSETTDTYSFFVIDYGVTMAPETAEESGNVDDTVWYDMTVTNEGVLADAYLLEVDGNVWTTLIMDETGTSEITVTDAMSGDETFGFRIGVLIPVSWDGDHDEVTITATSVTDPGYSATSLLTTTSLGEPWAIPFSEIFASTDLDDHKWDYIVTVDVNEIGIGEPTEPMSLNMNGFPNGRDTLVSVRMALAGESGVLLTYYYQRTGAGNSPELGDDLFVEYMDTLGDWQLINQHMGDGDDMTTFEQVEVALPEDAYHDGFRLRIHSKGSAGSSAMDDWFIDDIYVGHPRPEFLCGDVDGDWFGPDIADLIYFVDWSFNEGPEPPVVAAADVDGSGGTPDIADIIYLVEYMFSEGPDPVCQ